MDENNYNYIPPQVASATKKEVPPVARYKKFCIYLMDLIVIFIFSFSIYIAGYSIYVNSKKFNTYNDRLDTLSSFVQEIYVESGLTYSYTQDNVTFIKESKDLSTEFVKGSLLTKLQEKESSLVSDSYFKDVTPINKENDFLYKYYFSYYLQNKNEYDLDLGEDLSTHDFALKVFSYLNSSSVVRFEEKDDYYCFTDVYISDFIAKWNNNRSVAESDINSMITGYKTLYESYSSHFEEHNIKFYTALNEYNDNYSPINKTIIALALSSFFLGILIFDLLIPSLLKDGRTIFMKIFKVKAVTTTNTPITIGNNIIKSITSFLILLFIPCVYAIIPISFPEGFYVLIQDFLGIFNLFTLGTLTILFTICSLIFTLFSAKRKQTFSEAFASMVWYEDERTKVININGKEIAIK